MDEFRRKVLKVDHSRNHKVKNSIGVYDIYKHIRKNKWYGIGQPITEHQFYTIIRQVNNVLADNLLKGNDIVFPNKMGRLEVRKFEPIIRFDDNKLTVRLPIDWDRTLKLWSEDEEAYKERTLVKMEEKEIFKVCYNKTRADFQNKGFYQLQINRDLKIALKKKIKLDNFDAFLL